MTPQRSGSVQICLEIFSWHFKFMYLTYEQVQPFYLWFLDRVGIKKKKKKEKDWVFKQYSFNRKKLGF